MRCFDLRAEQTDPPKVRKHRIRKGRVVRRDMRKVTGITIHQTATPCSVAPYQVRAAGGDEDLALARRALGVACHGMAFRRGFYALANPLDWYVNHGNEFNPDCLGLEIEGRFPGLLADPARTTWGGAPTELTPELLEAAKACLRHLVEEARAAGAPLEWVNAHRQSSETRRSDPGEEPWRELVLGYAVPVLGLKVNNALVRGSGRPIPLAWDPVNGVGRY